MHAETEHLQICISFDDSGSYDLVKMVLALKQWW